MARSKRYARDGESRMKAVHADAAVGVAVRMSAATRVTLLR
jgi:hypothetical protein